MLSRALVRRRLCAVPIAARFLVGAAFAGTPGFAGAAALDGAGLFALPPDPVLILPASLPPRPRSLPIGERLFRSLARTVERAKGLGVAPMIRGFQGFGVIFSGRL